MIISRFPATLMHNWCGWEKVRWILLKVLMFAYQLHKLHNVTFWYRA